MSAPVFWVGPDETIPSVARKMRTRRVSGLPVVADGRLVGIITEADILLKEVGLGGLPELAYMETARTTQRLKATVVRDLMVPSVVTATEDTLVRDVAVLMNRHGINRIPIVRDDVLVGIVTRADIIALFDRPTVDLLDDVRTTLRDGLLVDPGRLEIVVKDGVVSLNGEVDDIRDIGLIETFVAEIDGLAGVDTSGIRVRPAGRALATGG